MENGYDDWAYVDFHNKEKLLKEMADEHEATPSDAEVEDPKRTFGAPDTLCLQNSISSQLRRIDATKIQSSLC